MKYEWSQKQKKIIGELYVGPNFLLSVTIKFNDRINFQLGTFPFSWGS
jgi:hypothetical protein